jgi:general secretion pathway protein M
MKRTVTNWWLGLQERERRVLLAGTLILALLLFYQLLWRPWHVAIGAMEESLIGLRTELVWMQQQAEMIQDSGGVLPAAQVKGADASLMAVIEQTSRAAGVREAIQQLTPRQNNTQVSVVMEAVSFNRWISWVDRLETQYGVTIIELNAERDNEKPDVAEIRVTFLRR